MDGLALACRIQQHSPGVAVVTMTGSGKESIISGKINVVDEVIEKPFSLEKLDGTIRNLHGKVF